jgi:hypothetical protein
MYGFAIPHALLLILAAYAATEIVRRELGAARWWRGDTKDIETARQGRQSAPHAKPER